MLEEVWSEFPHLLEVTVRSVLGHFLFSGEEAEKKIRALSGGEKARVSLAKLMLKKANVLILDEPTNHLDLYSKEALEAALMEYEGTLLFISHDRYFLNKLAERVLELDASGLQHFLGNFDDYVEKKKELEEIQQDQERKQARDQTSIRTNQAAVLAQHPNHGELAHGHTSDDNAADAPSGQLDYAEMKRRRQEERNRKRKAEQMEQEIMRLEEEIRLLEEEVSDPEIYTDHVKLLEKNEMLEQKRRELDEAYAVWESFL